MNLDVCNGLLEAIALFNDGSNHAATYTMQTLPAATSLDASLAAYFSAMSTSRVPAQPAEEWHIRTRELDGGEAFRQIAHHWFFRQEFSPKVDNWMAENVVATFVAHIQSTVGNAKLFRVRVSPPMWYECVWEDVAFDAQGGRWLLHLGFSD
jgi:hypothetical protein